MKKRRLFLLFGACAALLLAGCQKQGGEFDRVIRFTAKSQPGVDTKTAYSGQTYTESSHTFERINWVDGDEIRIYSDKAKTKDDQTYADYTVSTITAADRYSQAQLTGSGLLWGEGQGAYHFWGIYPPQEMTITGYTGIASGLAISATQDVIAANKTETSTLTAFTPDMSSAWMVADTPNVTEGTSSFSLDFYPAFTAFQFNIASQFDATLKVKSFTLSSTDTDIAGTFKATLDTGGASVYDNFSGSRSISVSFGTGVDIDQTKALQFTVLALPRDISKLSISFVVEMNGAEVTRKLDLKVTTATTLSGHPLNAGDWIIFDACKKHEISGLVLPSGDLQLNSVTVNDWTEGPETHKYTTPATSILALQTSASYRRYDSDGDYTSWAGSHIVASYGYRTEDGEIVVTDNPARYQVDHNTLLSPEYSPILRLVTTDVGPEDVLSLQLDNPRFKFVRYGTDSVGEIDLTVRNHSVTDRLEIVSGSTFFSVVPVEQFSIDTPFEEKTCRVSLLSVSPGILRELPFNLDGSENQAFPGESEYELKFRYFAPAVYATTGIVVSTP